MIKLKNVLERASKKMGVARSDLEDFFKRGEQVAYAAEDWLFHESTPRQWAGMVIDGEVTIVRGLHGSTRHLAVLTPGALIAEGAFLEEEAHATGAFTRNGATVWQISQAALAKPFGRKSRINLLPHCRPGGRGYQRPAAHGCRTGHWRGSRSTDRRFPHRA
jgi:CRP-like cAMP-binding protein